MLTKSNSSTPHGLSEVNSGDRIKIELDLRENEGEKRTMHIFVNGVQQKPFGTHIPLSPQFAVQMFQQNDSMIFVSYSTVKEPLHTHVDQEELFRPRR